MNGGSFRVYVVHRDSPAASVPARRERVNAMRAREQGAGLLSRAAYQEFSARVRQIGAKLQEWLRTERREGREISAYGASTKGNTLLQVFGLDHTMIRSAAERNPEKWGKYTVGTWIPIDSEAEARAPMIFWCCRGTSWMKLRRASTIFWRGAESSSRRCRICA